MRKGMTLEEWKRIRDTRIQMGHMVNDILRDWEKDRSDLIEALKIANRAGIQKHG